MQRSCKRRRAPRPCTAPTPRIRDRRERAIVVEEWITTLPCAAFGRPFVTTAKNGDTSREHAGETGQDEGQRSSEDAPRHRKPFAGRNVHNVDRDCEPSPPDDRYDRRDEGETEFSMFRVGKHPQKPMVVSVEINGKELEMEVDTGAAVSVISAATRDRMFPDCQLINTSTVLTTYTGEQMTLEGEITVKVMYGKQRAVLTLFVVKGDGPSLLGRDWLQKIRLDWSSICVVIQHSWVQEIV